MHYCDCKGTTKLQLLQRVFQRMLTLLSPVVIGGIVYTCFPQVILNRLATLLQVQLQYFKFFFRHNTIIVVVVCTIADAKVQRNYNCYNVYFNECLRNLTLGPDPRGKFTTRERYQKRAAATPFMTKNVAADNSKLYFGA